MPAGASDGTSGSDSVGPLAQAWVVVCEYTLASNPRDRVSDVMYDPLCLTRLRACKVRSQEVP